MTSRQTTKTRERTEKNVRFPVEYVVRRDVDHQASHLLRQVRDNRNGILVQSLCPFRILFRNVGPPFRRAVKDDIHVSLLLLITEESSGGFKVEQVELLVRWKTGGGVGAGKGKGDDGVPVGVEVLCCGSSEDAGCSCDGLVLSAEAEVEPTCDNNFHGAGMANGDEGIEKEMEGRMG